MIVAAENILQIYLIGDNEGTTPNLGLNWPIFTSFLPEEAPDNAILVKVGAEIKTDGTEQRTGLVMEHFPVQVWTRSIDFPGGQEVMNTLDLAIVQTRKVNVTVNGHNYIINSAIRKTSVVHMGQETKNRRELFMGNYILSIKELN